MASNHQPRAPSLEFSNDSDSDCYIIDSGSEVEIQFGDDTESELVDSTDLGSEDEIFEVSEFEYEGISESSTGEVTETVPNNRDDDNMDDSVDDIYDFGPNVPDRIIWGKTIFSKRFLEVILVHFWHGKYQGLRFGYIVSCISLIMDMILFFTCHNFPHSMSSQYVSWLDTEALMRT